MNISRSEAEAALSDIEQAAMRTYTQRSYRIAAPILILWGVIWLIGYVVMGAMTDGRWGMVWLPLDLIGLAGTIMLVRRSHCPADSGRSSAAGRQSLLHGLAILLLVVSTFVLFRPTSPAVYLAYPGLICGFAYMMFGIMRMPRLAWIGLAMFALTLVGFFYAKEVLAFWMAAVGGGGLILGGLWLRKL